MHFETEKFPAFAESNPPQLSGEMNRSRHRGCEPGLVRRTRRLISCLCAGSVLCAVLVLHPIAVPAQESPSNTPPTLAPHSGAPRDGDTSFRKLAERMAKQRNDDRQRKIVADTARLLAMAQKLNDEVSHSSKNELSISVVEQATEIEKLAKSIKDKMKNGY